MWNARKIAVSLAASQSMLLMGLLAPQAAADEELQLLPQTEVFRFNTEDKFFEKRKYSEDFRIKGWEVSENVYFGEAKVAGRKGPGLVVEQGNLSWGFNHRGAEVLFRF